MKYANRTIVTLAFTLTSLFVSAQEPYQANAARGIQHCIVTLAEQADLAPNEAGIVKDISVREGQRVDANHRAIRLDHACHGVAKAGDFLPD